MTDFRSPDDLALLAPLLGTWAGQGAGEYPTIEPFGYSEEVTFGHVGKPFLSYVQTDEGPRRRTAPARRDRLHPGAVAAAGSNGCWRIRPASRRSPRATLAVTGTTVEMELRATTIGRTASAKDVTALGRWIRVADDELTYTLLMGAVGQPLQHHLAATLRRRKE